MLNGLTREVRWRDVTEEMPAQTGNVLAAQLPEAPPLYGDGERAVCRAAYWDGREFRALEVGYRLRTVTHWMPFPELPKADAMRRVFRELLSPDGEESPC